MANLGERSGRDPRTAGGTMNISPPKECPIPCFNCGYQTVEEQLRPLREYDLRIVRCLKCFTEHQSAHDFPGAYACRQNDFNQHSTTQVRCIPCSECLFRPTNRFSDEQGHPCPSFVECKCGFRAHGVTLKAAQDAWNDGRLVFAGVKTSQEENVEKAQTLFQIKELLKIADFG